MTITEQFTEILVEYPRRTILSDSNGAYSAEQIYNTTQFILSEELNGKSFSGKRIAVFCHPGLSYVTSMIAGWMSGAMMVPLCITHPEGELQHVLTDANPEIIFADKDIAKLLPKTNAKIITPDFRSSCKEPTPANYSNPLVSDPALMLYTSGTTGKAKGVVHSHASLVSQITCLVDAWQWTESDRILHFLPLHHTHGIINKWLCALWVGARCDMMEKFDAQEVWNKITNEKYTVFMAVPTVYVKMIDATVWSNFDSAQSDNRNDEPVLLKRHDFFSTFRLMVSGSAALPVSVLEKWKEITGHTLLERYGMTETGMVLSNPYKGERKAGAVGQVLPGMEVRIVNESGEVVDEEGELQVKGKNLFDCYWNNPARTTVQSGGNFETKKSFTKDNWFKTGDMVRLENGYYYIIGRLSTDIIKSGGYKISALEIESVLLENPNVKECAVCGLADETWGEKIGVAIVWKEQSHSLEEIRDWMQDKLASYKLPAVLVNVDQLPRNVMGKVMRNEIRLLLHRNHE